MRPETYKVILDYKNPGRLSLTILEDNSMIGTTYYRRMGWNQFDWFTNGACIYCQDNERALTLLDQIVEEKAVSGSMVYVFNRDFSESEQNLLNSL